MLKIKIEQFFYFSKLIEFIMKEDNIEYTKEEEIKSNNKLQQIETMKQDFDFNVGGNFISYVKDKNILDKLKKEWVKIGDIYEYKLSCAFGGERVNLLCRIEGRISDSYNIIFAGDIDLFY